MSWVDRLWPRKSIDDSGVLARMIWGGMSSKSGQAVNLDSALRVSTVLSCARVIAEGVAQPPCKLVLSQGDVRTVQADHPAHRLLNDEPNEWMTPFELFEQMGLHLALAGNAYLFKVFGLNGDVIELLPMLPNWVSVKQSADWTLEYQIRFPGKAVQPVPAASIWHVRGPSWVGYLGMNMVSQARDAIGLSLATEEFGSKLFANGAKPSGIVTTDPSVKMDREQLEKFRADWEEAYSGTANAMKTVLMTGGAKYSAMSMTSDEAQFIDSRKYQVEDTCRFFRVLPIMIGHSGDKNATFASAEQMFNANDVYTYGPWWARIEQSARKNLLSRADQQRGMKFKFTGNALMRGSAEARSAYFAKALGAGGAPAWMTQDEVRRIEDLNPLGGAAAKLPIATNVPASAP